MPHSCINDAYYQTKCLSTLKQLNIIMMCIADTSIKQTFHKIYIDYKIFLKNTIFKKHHNEMECQIIIIF